MVIVGLVLVVIVAAIVWLFVSGGGQPSAQPAVIGPIPLTGHQVCADQVRIYVDTDADMTHIAAVVRVNPLVRAIYTQTKHEAYEQFQQEFADQPELRSLGREEALPASVVIVPVAGMDVRLLAGTFRRQFTDAKQVESITQAISATALRSIGETAPPTPCPASGEFPNH